MKNGVIVTMDGQRRILENHSIIIENGRIAEIGKTTDLEKKQKFADILDASGFIVMP